MLKQQEHDLKYTYIKILDSLLKEDLHEHDMLFSCEEDSTPMEFCMKPSKDEQYGEIMKKLAILVDKCGGSMKFNNFYKEGTNSIKLVNKGEILLDANEDYFYSNYLIECMQEKKLKNLNHYRANKSKYCSSLNVMDILNKRKIWSQADRTKVSDEEISDFDIKEASNSKYSHKKMWKKSKSTYSIEEDLKILQYIVNHKAFHRVKSRSLWQEMEKKKVCNGRTWQSMKERMKYIIIKIKTYHLSELNQSALVEGFMNPNSNDRVQYPDYSSTESENEDVLCTTQYSDKSVTNSTLVEQNINCSQVTDQNATLLCDKQMTPSTTSECLTSDKSRCGNTISECEKDVHEDGVNYRTNSTNSIHCMNEDFESTNEKNCDKEMMDDIILNEKIVTTNDGSEDDVETSLNNYSGKDGEEDKENESFIAETDIEDNENFESMLPGINNFLRYNEDNINSFKRTTTNNNIITDRSQLVEMANQSRIIKDKNSDEAENIDSLSCDLECQQSLSDVKHNSILYENQNEKSFDDDKSMSISMESIKRYDSTHESDYVENSSDCDSKDSLYTSLDRRKAETSIRDHLKISKSSSNMLVNKRVDSKHSRDKLKYKLTFHKKYGCKRALISNSRGKFEDSIFSISEDVKIIQYIYKYNAIDRISSKELWISMEERAFKNERSWGSLKERFNKRILPNIKCYQEEGVSERVVNFFSEEFKKKNPDASSVKENDSSKASPEFSSDRSYYTIGEKQAMVDYIIKNGEFESIKGKSLYKKMAVEIELPSKKKRTDQSLENTFKKYIMPNIEDFVMSEEDRLAFNIARKRKRKKRKFKRTDNYNGSSDSESNVNAVAKHHIPKISKILRATSGDGHIKHIEFSLSSDDSDNVKNNNPSSSEIMVDDFKSKNFQNYSDNNNVNKGRKFVNKRKLFTETDELFMMTPYGSPKQNIPQKTLSKKETVPLASISNECTTETNQSEVMSQSKHESPNNLSRHETEVREKHTSPFNGTILKQTEPAQKNSSCETQIPNEGNEIILSHTPSKKHLINDQSNRTLSSCKKRNKTKDIEEFEKHSPSSSACKQKLSTYSNVSPGKPNKEDQMMDAIKPNLRSKPKPDTTLRKDLRVRKVNASKKTLGNEAMFK